MNMTPANMNMQKYIPLSDNKNRRMKVHFNTHAYESRRIKLISKNIKSSTELEHLEALGKNFPNGCLFRFQIKADILESGDMANFWEHLHLCYSSFTWEEITNIPLDDAMQNSLLLFEKIHPDDMAVIIPLLYKSLVNSTVFSIEMRYQYTVSEIRWYHLTMQPRPNGVWIVCDGFLHDITKRKKEEMELSLFRGAIEPLIKERTNELEALKEELTAVKKELERKNVQLHNETLAHMKVAKQLEDCRSNRKTF